MPSLGGAISATQAKFSVTVKRTGRIRPPNLPDAQLKAIGDVMVTAQKLRWDKAINADGQIAKKLSVRWAIIKQAVLHKRPERDMRLTGKTIKNFQLRKASLGKIRAENTTRYERQKAAGCNSYDQMIGFSLFDAKQVFAQTQTEFGQWVNKAWIPLDGTNRRASTLNVLP
jgi:hypothetical protein